MRCPFCGEVRTQVKNSRKHELGVVRRHRECPACGKVFTTTERITADSLIVRKRSGELEPYARSKIVKGINKDNKRGQGKITPADVNAIVDRVEQHLRALDPGTPVPSIEIGRLVLQELHDGTVGTDVVRVRYAIVFQGRKTHRRGFRGIRGLLEWIEDVYGRPLREPPTDTPWEVKKRNGRVEPFQLRGLAASIGIAAKGHGTDNEVFAFAERLAHEAKANLKGQAIVTSQQIAAEVLKLLIREGDMLRFKIEEVEQPVQERFEVAAPLPKTCISEYGRSASCSSFIGIATMLSPLTLTHPAHSDNNPNTPVPGQSAVAIRGQYGDISPAGISRHITREPYRRA